MINYLKISSAVDLTGRDRFLYRALEILPAALSWGSLIILALLSWLKSLWVAYFIIFFDVYWLLLVFYLSLHLIAAYQELKKNMKINWADKCRVLPDWQEIWHLVILPVYNEDQSIIRSALEAIKHDGYPLNKFIIILAAEERAGETQITHCRLIAEEYKNTFGYFLLTVHPDGIAGELKGKGANQSWAAREARRQIIDPEQMKYDKILVSVFDIDTIVPGNYFFRLTHAFLTCADPYHTSFQPVPVYNNNLWQAPFFARTSAYSNTFWQMMQQIRQEKLATYSSHSMTWKALVDIDFWATNMVSEDSRIFWHCYCFYNGRYHVEPLYFSVSMDACQDKTFWQTMKNLYKQQRRWGWGVENLPYLIFNAIKRWRQMPKKQLSSRIFVQIYGFHSWATNALIIAVIGWLPLLIGGADFNSTAISGNLPFITRTLMTIAMLGLVLSAVISTLLLPARSEGKRLRDIIVTVGQWIFLPLIIIFFGAIPALEAQLRLALGGKWRLGFWVTPKRR